MKVKETLHIESDKGAFAKKVHFDLKVRNLNGRGGVHDNKRVYSRGFKNERVRVLELGD